MADWIEIQKKTFTKWANSYLRKRKDHKIEDLYTDLEDGIKLINLVGLLGKSVMSENPEPRRYNKTPKMRIHRMENLKMAFDFMRQEKVKLINIGAEDIIDRNEKIILATFWNLIQRYSVDTVDLDGISGKAGLLLWCQRQTKGYDGVDVTDFKGSWKDGRAFLALIHRNGGRVDPSITDPAKALETAFRCAEEQFDLEPLIDVEDMLEADVPDEKVVITQLAAWFKEFASRAKGENLIKAVHTAIEVTRRHDRWIEEYDSNSTRLKTWVAEATKRFGNCKEGADGHGDTTGQIKATLDSFYAYRREDKPAKAEELPDVGALLVKLHSSQKPNNRTLFAPADGRSPQVLQEDWSALEVQEDTFEKSARDAYIHFQRLEVTIEKFNSKQAKALAWLQSQRSLFEAGDYGDSVVACGALLANYSLFEEQLKLYRDGAEKLRAMTRDDGMSLHAESPTLRTKMDELDEAIKSTDEAGRRYKDMLMRNKKEYAKLAQLAKPETWTVRAEELFADEDVGTTMVKNQYLLKRFKEVYSDEHPVQEATVRRIQMLNDADAPQDAGVAVKLDSLIAKMDELKTQSGAYMRKLTERQQELGELADQIKDFNSLCTEFIFSVDVLDEELAAPLHADSLDEAQALVDKFNEETQPAVESIKQQFRQIDQLGRALYASKEADAQSAFSQYDLNMLNQRGGSAVKAILQYKQRLMGDDKSFFQMEKAKEELRLGFADKANKAKKFMTTTEAACKALGRSPLEQQIEQLEIFETKHGENHALIEEAAPIAAKLDEMGVINNPHTTETMASLEIQSSVLQKLITASLATARETLALNKQLDEWTQQYEAAADEIVQWIAEAKTPWVNCREGKDGHGETTGKIKDSLDAFYRYKKVDKPPMNTKLAAAKELLGQLHASQRKNNRPLYVAQQGRGMKAIETKWDELASTEDKFENSIRTSYAHFQHLDGTIAKFTVKCTKIMEWLDARDKDFAKKDYGNSALMVKTLQENFTLYEQQMQLYKDPEESYDSLVNGNGMELHEQHPSLVEKLSALQAALETTEANGTAYEQALRLNAAEYEKLSKLLRPESWMDDQLALFGRKEYGVASTDVAHLLTEFREGFTDKLQGIKQVLTRVRQDVNPSPPSPEPKVEEKLQGLEAKLEQCEKEAAEYKSALDERAKACAAVVAQVQDYNAKAAALDFGVDALEEELAVSPDAVDVKEAQDMVETHEKVTKGTLEALKSQLAALKEIAAQLEGSTEKEAESAFSRFKIADLSTKVDGVAQTVARYSTKLERELQEEQEREALRLKFAEGAKALKQHLNQVSGAISELSGDTLQEQLENLNEIDGKESPSLKSELDALEPTARTLEEKGVLDNEHTPETIYSLRGGHNALQKQFKDTREALENNIQAEKSGGLTPDQFKEIKEVFDHFDKSGDGQLDLTEFGTCTTAIGLVLSEEEIATHMKELDTSGDGQLSFDEFIAFMKDQLTASGASVEDVLNAFREIAGPPAPPAEGEPMPPLSVSHAKIGTTFVGEYATDAPYLYEHMPKAEGAGASPDGADGGGEDAAVADGDVLYLCEPFVDQLFTR